MFCKWCGMESAATDLCSWCHRPLSATATDAPAPAVETPVKRDPPAPLVEAEEEEESPLEAGLASGIAADRTVRRPTTPGHRPAWAPVPRAGATATSASPPTQPAPPSHPSATTEPQAPFRPSAKAETTAGETATGRPIIGVRRQGGVTAPGTDSGAPTSAPIGVRRPNSVNANPTSGAPAHAPAPSFPRPAPGTPRPVPGSNNRSVVPAPAAPRTPASNGAAPTVSRDPFVRPPAPTGNTAAGATSPTSVPVNTTATTLLRPKPLPLITEEEESGGLADGIAAGKRPVDRTAGVPALGTFTPANSKYYAGQVLDPLSGTHYDSVTGQATSVNAPPKLDNIVLQWDDPISTPRQIGRFALAFTGLLIGMAGLTHMLPDYAAIPLVIVMFAAGVLLPVMKAVPFQSDDSDDLVWLVLLTLLFGPSIGLLIYSIKAFLLKDMNIAVLGLLAVGFLGYVVFQLSVPLMPLTPDVNEGFFNLAKLAPPWSQVSRYGYPAMLYNWAGLVAMAGWFLANVFRKLDE